MIQGGDYVLSPDFISTYRKIDYDDADIMWNIVLHPTETTIKQLLSLLFNCDTNVRKSSLRYFDPIVNKHLHTTTSADDSQVEPTTSDSSSTLSRINASITSANLPPKPPSQPLDVIDSFVQIPYAVDRIPNPMTISSSQKNNKCPDTVEEALYVVSLARRHEYGVIYEPLHDDEVLDDDEDNHVPNSSRVHIDEDGDVTFV